jgi:TctA family transporter
MRTEYLIVTIALMIIILVVVLGILTGVLPGLDEFIQGLAERSG